MLGLWLGLWLFSEMPKKAKELSPIEVKRLTSPGFHAIGGVAGLHLQVKDTGARSWILRTKIGGRRRDLGLGGYPDVSLATARDKAREAREQIRMGIDPIEAKKIAKATLVAAQAKEMTFEQAAIICHRSKAPGFRNTKHSSDWINSVNRYVVPMIGELPVNEVDLPHIVKILDPIWETKTETATRVRQRIESVLAWATVSGYRTGDNPARWKGSLEHALAPPSKVRRVKHFAALPWTEVGEFMIDLRTRKGMAARALEFLILTAARSGEVRLATWDEIDVGAKLWTIPGERMKAGKAHRVPLSGPALKILKALPGFNNSPYVFTSVRGRALSNMSISAVCKRMKVDAVPHGFRSTFKDWCRSSTAFADEVSELALAHVNSDATRSAYARDELLPKRTSLMKDWARYCGRTPGEAGITPIGERSLA